MVQYLHTNNANSNLRDAITAASTQVRVTSGHGSLFPNPGIDQAFFVTVEDRRTGRLEIMRCNQRTTDTLTVTRGQQGTVPQSFVAGVNVSNRVTATILNEFVAATVSEIPVSRLPQIPDANLIGMNAAKLTGTINSARLPAIPSTLLTNVPAANLSGLVQLDNLPVLDLAHLPQIPDAKITSMSATKLIGDVPVANLPVIPNANIENISASKLVGGSVSPAVMLSSTYTFDNVVITGLGNFNRIWVNAGSQGAPGYTFDGALNSGFYWTSASSIGVSIDGVLRLQVTDTIIHAHSGMKFSGSGGSLHSIPSTALPQPGTTADQSTERGRIAGHIADFAVNAIGSYAMMEIAPGNNANFGTLVTGNFLRPAAANGLDNGAYRPSSETWMCCGYTPGSDSGDFEGQKVTLWRRVS